MNAIITWINGSSMLIIVLSAYTCAVIDWYYYKKTKKKLYINGVFIFLAVGLGWTGGTLAFISLLINNGYTPTELVNIIGFFTVSTMPIGILFVINLMWGVIGAPENKKYILAILIALSVVYYISLYTTYGYSLNSNAPLQVGELYDDWLNLLSIPYLCQMTSISITAIVIILGFNNFRKVSTGDSKKRAKIIIFASFMFSFGILGDVAILGSLVPPYEYLLWIPRSFQIFANILEMYAFRPKKE